MRKQVLPASGTPEKTTPSRFIDVENLARVELSSEEASHPIETALRPGAGPGWRAALPGPQTIRLIFDTPQQVRQVNLEFVELATPRTQEFVLRWSPDGGQSYREVVRQQFNFAPPDTNREREEYQVNLTGVTALELVITPDLGRPEVYATLSRLLLS